MVELSFVIPVFNGAGSIAAVVSKIVEGFKAINFEIILVNDGSSDHSEKVCNQIVEQNQSKVIYLHLSRNFSEHNAVLAGINRSTGNYIAILDDDGQNPPEEVEKLYQEITREKFDVVYGKYKEKQHHFLRNLGSAFNSKVANYLLNKPADIYLSSFKIMNRFVANEICKYRGAFPYIDGLIFRTTQNIGQIYVEHRERELGESGYTFSKLVSLWANMFLNFSIKPLRAMAIFGIFISLLSVFLIIAIVIDKLLNPDFPIGLPSIMVGVVFFAGIQLLLMGLVGEYLGRLFLDYSGKPQFVVRYESSTTTKGN